LVKIVVDLKRWDTLAWAGILSGTLSIVIINGTGTKWITISTGVVDNYLE
jgi:hypothetical protein